MSAPKWTPGPWRPGRPDMLNERFERGFGKTIYTDDDRGGFHHATGTRLPLDVGEAFAPEADECLANAHLIAAAPDLYEALQEMYEASATGRAVPIGRALSALRKARGEKAAHAKAIKPDDGEGASS